MKYLCTFLLLHPAFAFSICKDKIVYDKKIESIYSHAESECLKYEVLAGEEKKHDIFLIYMGKKQAYTDMMNFISSMSNFYD